MQSIPLSDAEFMQVRALAYRALGIHLADSKKALIVGRWGRRLSAHKLKSFAEYLELLRSDTQRTELQTALDLLTTNETHFFREKQHFDYLRQRILPSLTAGASLRVWSAACSSGEEPYSIAMLLADWRRDGTWEVLGSDISTRVLEQARAGKYPMERARSIPGEYLKRFCLKGMGPETGSFLIDRSLRERVHFRQINLNESLPTIGAFDVILLRNVMIYFDAETKSQVVKRLLAALKPGGYFLIGHCETLHGIATGLETAAVSVYRKPLR